MNNFNKVDLIVKKIQINITREFIIPVIQTYTYNKKRRDDENLKKTKSLLVERPWIKEGYFETDFLDL